MSSNADILFCLSLLVDNVILLVRYTMPPIVSVHRQLFYSALLGGSDQDIQDLTCQVYMGLVGLHASIAAIARIVRAL